MFLLLRPKIQKNIFLFLVEFIRNASSPEFEWVDTTLCLMKKQELILFGNFSLLSRELEYSHNDSISTNGKRQSLDVGTNVQWEK